MVDSKQAGFQDLAAFVRRVAQFRLVGLFGENENSVAEIRSEAVALLKRLGLE